MSNMKRLIAFLLLISSVASAQVGSPIQIPGGSKFKGGTLTQNLTMSDETVIELATGTTANLSLRFGTDPDTGIRSLAANEISFITGGSRRFYANANAFYVDSNIPITGPGNSLGIFYIPTVAASAKGLYTWKLDTNATIRYVGVGPASTTLGYAHPAMYSDNGTTNPKQAQVWASETTAINVNVGIGTSTPDCALHNLGFSRLGELSPKLKCKLFEGNMGPNEGGVVSITHGLDTKILFVTGWVIGSDGAYYSPEHTYTAEAQYSVRWGNENLQIISASTSSGLLVNQGYKMLALYTE